MKKSIAVCFLAPIAFCAIPPTHSVAGITNPTGLPVGSQYQLIFVTADLTTAASSDIAYYNNFVTAEAALNPSLPAGVMWHAVISTTAASAVDNAPSIGLPIFDTAGDEVASAGLYTPDLLAPPEFTQFGMRSLAESVWTGSFPTGLASESPAGAESVEWGLNTVTDSDWIDEVTGPNSYELPLYALSSPIAVVPEPGSITLLGSALLGIGVPCLRRRVARR